MKRAVTYILLGGNLGNTPLIFYRTRQLINSTLGSIEVVSSLYYSEPWGFESEYIFTNQVIKLLTPLEAPVLLNELLSIEEKFGRVRKPNKKGYENRILDLDILYFNNEKINLPNLKIPHPLIMQRDFVKKPLFEIASEPIENFFF